MTASLQFAAIGIDHRHIYGMAQNMLNVGAEFVGWHADGEPETTVGFLKRFPGVPPTTRRGSGFALKVSPQRAATFLMPLEMRIGASRPVVGRSRRTSTVFWLQLVNRCRVFPDFLMPLPTPLRGGEATRCHSRMVADPLNWSARSINRLGRAGPSNCQRERRPNFATGVSPPDQRLHQALRKTRENRKETHNASQIESDNFGRSVVASCRFCFGTRNPVHVSCTAIPMRCNDGTVRKVRSCKSWRRRGLGQSVLSDHFGKPAHSTRRWRGPFNVPYLYR